MSRPCLVPGLGVRAWNHWGHLSKKRQTAQVSPKADALWCRAQAISHWTSSPCGWERCRKQIAWQVPAFLSPQVVLGMATVVTAPKGRASSSQGQAFGRSLGRPDVCPCRVELQSKCSLCCEERVLCTLQDSTREAECDLLETPRSS